MPRRSPAGLDEVADIGNLAEALFRASRGCFLNPEARVMAADLDASLGRLAADIQEERAPEGRWTRFVIHDPKERTILAPSFRDRVLHHALMGIMGPVLDRALVDDTFACRSGRGSLAAVLRAQHHSRRFPWFVQADICAYFASVDHGLLKDVLERRFRDPGLLRLCARILDRAPDPSGDGTAGVGLPIGALTSQHFANTYLASLDRFLLEKLRVRGMVRYMDDFCWWCDSRTEARETLCAFRAEARATLRLVVHSDAHIGRSEL